METQALALARSRAAKNLPERLTWGPLTLSVTDLDSAVEFWTSAIGFTRRPDEKIGVALGTKDRTLVVLQPGAKRLVQNGHAGMYHVAFGMASQAEFSRRMERFLNLGVPFSAVDHLMSKALYLNDPDGHGIEIAWETPERLGRFADEGGRFAMYDRFGNPHTGREPLDLKAELAMSDGVYAAVPVHPATTVAHLHLHVPELAPALEWFESLGFARNLDLSRHGMADMGTGAAYTHRLAVNTWAGRGVSPAPANSARLLSYRLEAADAETCASARSVLAEDPQTGELVGVDPSGASVVMTLKSDQRDIGKTDAA